MNDHDLITYLLAINMTDLGFFPSALSEVAEGDIVSISYGSRAVNLMTALRCTVHKDAYGPGAYRTYVDTPLGASVTLYYHEPSNPGAGPHIRSVVLHDSDDLSGRVTPIIAPFFNHHEECSTRDAITAPAESADEYAVDAENLAEHILSEEAGIYRIRAVANVIREHLPAATRLALPEGHVAVDLRGIDTDSLQHIARTGDRPGCGISAFIAGCAAHAELARRDAELRAQ